MNKTLPSNLQKLADLTKTVRVPATGRIDWKRIEQEHPDAVADATENGRFTYKVVIDRLGYYLRRGPKSDSVHHPAAAKVPWTPQEIATLKSFQRYQQPNGTMDWDKIRSTDGYARVLTRHTDPRIKGKFMYLREHHQLGDTTAADNQRDLSERLTQIASKTKWTEDEEKSPNSHLALATAVKFCPYCGHDLQAHLRS